MEERVLKPMGSYLGVDAEGYLISEVSKDKIQSDLWPTINECIEIAKDILGQHLHSIYLRGSAAKGQFIAGISDLDMEFILNVLPDEAIKKEFKTKIEEVQNKNPEITKIEKQLILLAEYTKENDPLRLQSVCLYGEDLNQNLPRLKPGKDTRVHIPGILSEMERQLPRIESGEDTQPLNTRSKWLCKRLIRSSHELVAEKLQRFTRDIYPCYEGASQVFPEHEPLFRKVAEVAVFGTEDKTYLLDLARQMQAFLSVEISKMLTKNDK